MFIEPGSVASVIRRVVNPSRGCVTYLPGGRFEFDEKPGTEGTAAVVAECVADMEAGECELAGGRKDCDSEARVNRPFAFGCGWYGSTVYPIASVPPPPASSAA